MANTNNFYTRIHSGMNHFYKQLNENSFLHVFISISDYSKVDELSFNSDNRCLINNIPEIPDFGRLTVITEDEFDRQLRFAKRHLMIL